MSVVTTLDSRRRGVFPAPFQAGDVFLKVRQSAEMVEFRLVKPAEVPVVKAERRAGFTVLRVPPGDSRRIAAAIRADRDSR